MNERSEKMLEAARSGDEESFQGLLRALREDPTVQETAVQEFCASNEAVLRRAGIELARGREAPELMEALKSLAHDASDDVRRTLAIALHDANWWSDDGVVRLLLADESGPVRVEAVRAAARRPALVEQLLSTLSEDDFWQVRQAAAQVLQQHDSFCVSRALLDSVGGDGDQDVSQAAAFSLEHHLRELGGYPAELTMPGPRALRTALDRVRGWPKRRVERLCAWLDERCRIDVDVEQLASFGNVLTRGLEEHPLPRAHFAENAEETILRALQGNAPRAVVLLGPAGAGKTAIINSIAYRLAAMGWHMVRVAPADFLTGTTYLGEWQTRLSKLLDAIKTPRPVVLYIPNLDELHHVGRSSSSDSNVATALAPHIERGDVVVLGESTEESFQKGLGATPSLRRLFHAITLKPATVEATRAVLTEVARDLKVTIADSVLDRLCELADFVNASAALPGRAVELLRRVVSGLPQPRPITDRDILAAISMSSGVPTVLLDDTIKLDRAAVREFFEARVMGQPEAVDAAVDLVTLFKAGLTDPHKPLAVLLFVGPTGVGKTELARAMAEFCFGSPSRLVRLDMSEYASYEAYERLIGTTGVPGYLTSIVREQPFSILLFDEFEKGHFNIFDLCLQIFDAGRLTDGQGRTADFRRTIIVLTSNVGARSSQAEPIGFGLAPAHGAEHQARRDLQNMFRPEFLNRLDRVVQFQPLSEETAERIARREVLRVLERSGIKRRSLMVDCDPSLIPLLLREGYSRTYGARPLKRAIERLVLLPLARTIADGQLRPHSLVRLLARHGRVQLEVTPPAEAEEAAAPLTPLPADVDVRLAALAEQFKRFRDQAADLSAKKGVLLAGAASAGFWDNPPRAQQTYEQIFLLDSVLAQVDNQHKAVQRLMDSTKDREFRAPTRRLRTRLEELEARARQVEWLLSCPDPRFLGDAILSLTLVSTQGAPLGAVERLARMYMELARRRQFGLEILDDHRIDSPPEDSISLLLTGVGTYALLAHEAGLHSVSYGTKRAQGQEKSQQQIVRVEVELVDTARPSLEQRDIRSEIHTLDKAAGRVLRRPKYDARLLHVPTMTTIRAWTDGERAGVVERLLPLLAARVHAASQDKAPSPFPGAMVRRYRLGPSQLVRDLRTGRRTGRLDLVMAGHLDTFLVPLAVNVEKQSVE